MTTLPRRLSLCLLPLGCFALAMSVTGGIAHASAPESTAEADPPAKFELGEGDPVAVPAGAESAESPGPEATGAPADEATPEPEPVKEEPASPPPEEDPSTGSEATHPDEDGQSAVKINPLQGGEARPPGETIQIPVDIGDKHSITYTSLLAPRINPLGLEERLWIGYQYRLYDKDKTILNGSNIGIFFRPIVSPAIALIGATFQVQPAAVFRFRATYSFIQWYGNFQYMQSYQSPHDDWSETRLGGQTDFQESNYVTNGHQVELEALFQIRVKDLAIRSATYGIYNHYNLRGDDDLFYEVRYDTLTMARGWMLSNDTDVLWLQKIKGPRKATLILGSRASTVMPFYTKEVYEEGDLIDNPNGAQFRLGPALGYIFYNRPDRYPRFNRPTLLLIPQWNILHRYRSGRDVKTAFPTIVMAFVFTGQLWGRN